MRIAIFVEKHLPRNKVQTEATEVIPANAIKLLNAIQENTWIAYSLKGFQWCMKYRHH